MTTQLRVVIVSLCVGLAALVTARAARAQLCFQRVGGVPGAYNQPPDWWTPGSTPLGSATSRFIDDPRWQGATEYSHIGDTANFRALVETTTTGARNLVLAWHVRVDPANANDRLYVGFWDETSMLGNVFRIEKTVTTATDVVAGGTFASGAYNGRFFHISGTGTGWALNNATSAIVPPLPDWLKNDTRIDEICSGGTCDEWAVRMHIPIDPLADVAADNPTGVKLTTGGKFRFWYQIQNGMTLGSAAVYNWPDNVAVASEGAACSSVTHVCLPDPTAATAPWNEIQDGGTCHGDIGLQPGHIYANTAGSIQVSLSAVNHFHAQPTNFLTSPQSGDAIQATFRIANWGSAVGVSPGFLPICTNQISGPASPQIAPSGLFDIACDWTVPNPCDFKPAGDPCGASAGSRTPDQCLLVDLAASPHNGPFVFSPASAWQNMMFTGASRVEKTAILDLQALPALPGGNPNRDLYIYIKASNLARTPPAVDRTPIPPRPPTGRTNDGPAREREKETAIELPKRGAIDHATAQVLAEALRTGRLSFDEVQAIMPTYVAYVWHDSGQTLGTGAGATKLLDVQPSFGMFVWHDGDLNGWRHSFEGRNVTQLGPNFFKVSVPEGGTASVTARVTACQLPLCLDHYVDGRTLRLILLLALGLIILLLLLRLLVRKLAHP